MSTLLRRTALTGASTVLVLAGPLAGVAAADEPDDDESVRSMTIDVEVQPDGSVTVREEIDYDFGAEGHHGLVRSIPVRGTWDQTHDRLHPVDGLRVSSPTGAPDQVEQDTDDGRLVVRVGDPDEDDVTGPQTYVLEYRMAAVVDATPSAQEVVQDVVGTGWQVPIARVDVTLRAPGPLGDLSCVRGDEGSTRSCEAVPAADGSATFAARGLEAEQGVTVAATMPAGTVDAAPPVLDDTFSPARAFTLDGTTAGAGAAVLVLGVAGVGLARRRHRHPGAETLPGGAPLAVVWQPTPPDDAPPGVLGALVHGGAQDSDVVATLLDLARRGHLEVEQERGPDGTGGGDWSLHRTAGGDRTTAAEDRLLDTLFRGGADTSLSALRTTARAGTQAVRRALDEDVVARGWFSTTPGRFATRWFLRSGAVLLGAVVVAVLLTAFTTYAVVGVALVVVGILAVVGAVGLGPLTAAGRVARDRALAFRDTLSRYGDVDGATGTRFAGYLPHAVALDATDEWTSGARALQAARSPVPAPAWCRGYAGAGSFDAAVFAGTMGAFSAQTSGALSAAPPASTTTGSSGGYVGGGAGGGGGGSW